MALKTVLAVDLGAESGRVMAVHFDGHSLQLEELHRFENPMVRVHNTLHWDILYLWHNIQQGIEVGKKHAPVSIGVDGWGVDFGLLDAHGKLISNPVAYRDGRTQGMMQVAFQHIPKRAIFEQTGIQFIQINSLYQLMSLVESDSPQLDLAHRFLTIPDLINYWLTGEAVCEFTNATTTQMLNPRIRQWTLDMLYKLGIPTRIFPDVVNPGTRLGEYDGIPVIAPAAHDTACAVAAVPTVTADFAYISSGTWSLVGLELREPVINDASFEANLTNEGGVENTFRLLKNVMGLWILQQCRAAWAAQGYEYSYSELVTLAESASPLAYIIDVDDSRFLTPGDHPGHVRDWCNENHQPVPETHGEIVRCVLDSLALKYRNVLRDLAEISGQRVDVIHIVGGGTQNTLLNQLTADATGTPVITGPVEATVLGNAIVQFIALGDLSSVAEARQLIADMPFTHTYQPDTKQNGSGEILTDE
ncbi:MAG: rhamnulokinase [Chloroflexi bacterium]|nr:rhamnulokinase [Chloroflexota bacterium]